jgi:Family of unknown function (DUF6326)
MNSDQMLITMNVRAKLSTLWIFVLLNVIFRDIHELFRHGLLEEMMTGTVNGVQMTEGTLLVAGIMLEVLLAMVILSRVLEYRANRWANIVVGVIAIPLVIGIGPKDLDDMFFATIEVVALALIIWSAWTWPTPELGPN